jgi:MarR family 2-MHQ and catechol resistance regulon transcriptional repressor
MSKHFRGTEKQERALDAYIKLLRATDKVDSLVMPQLDGAGLSPSQFGVLEALYHVGPMCLTDLARKILKTSGNLTMVVRNLEKRGLVTRVRQVADRRYYLVSITGKGSKLIRQVFPGHVERIVKAMSELTASEQETLGELCRKLGTRLAQRQSK